MTDLPKYESGPGAEAYSTTAIIERCVRAAESKVIIAELLRRGRLRTLDYSFLYFPEMAGDDSYMAYVNRTLATGIGKGLGEAMRVEDREHAPICPNDNRKVRRASVVVLVTAAQAKPLDTESRQG
jgi:hypothetical protein